MGSCPWGPHGPQSGPNQVTPNPTPSYSPPAWNPPASSNWGAPASTPVSYGGGGGYTGYTGPPKPRTKSYILAVFLALIFGPLGLFYASKKGALVTLLFLVGVPVSLNMFLSSAAVRFTSNPFAILENSTVMDQFWRLSVLISVIWSVVAVIRFNRKSKAEFKAAAEVPASS